MVVSLWAKWLYLYTISMCAVSDPRVYTKMEITKGERVTEHYGKLISFLLRSIRRVLDLEGGNQRETGICSQES